MTQAEWIMLWLCAVAALLHGLSGFGFPLLSTAVLSSAYLLFSDATYGVFSIFMSLFLALFYSFLSWPELITLYLFASGLFQLYCDFKCSF